MMKRRKFLLGGLGVVGLTGLGIWGFGRFGIESVIVSVLRRRLDYLQLDEAGLHAFAKDQTTKIINKRVSMGRLRYHVLSAVGSSFQRYQRSTVQRSRIEQGEDLLVSTYLLSSDFFTHGSDETRTVGYVAYYDPMRPCGNPFARFAAENPSAS
jgi:hypothetical protein